MPCFAVQLLAESGFDAPRRIIDVCGDGTNNAGRDVKLARDETVWVAERDAATSPLVRLHVRRGR